MQTNGNGKFKFAIDRGGTFTDVYAVCPDGKEKVTKLLSVDPKNYFDAPREGIRRILEEVSTCFKTINCIKAILLVSIGNRGCNATRSTSGHFPNRLDKNGHNCCHKCSTRKKRRKNGFSHNKRLWGPSLHWKPSKAKNI